MLTQSSLSKATYYLSDLGHYACKKNAMMIGLPEKGLRIIPTNTHFKMDPQALRRQIEEDRAQGLCPTLIVANAGNTYTGNVDDLNEIANLASSTGVWLHVDAAYGGFFTLTETGKTCLKGIERADSIALDPHKTLCLPLGSGTLLVKDRQQLMSAHQCQGYRYAPTQADDAAAIDFSECSAELSRECRGLRIWLPFKMLGIDAFKRNLQDKIQLIQWAHQQILRIPNAQVISAPELTVLTFRYYQDGYDEQALNTINRGLLQTINAQNQVRLMKMTVKGQETIRICTLSFRTYRTHLETGIKLIQAAFTDTSLIKDLLET